MALVFHSGFEMGLVNEFDSIYEPTAIATGIKKTGAYSLRLVTVGETPGVTRTLNCTAISFWFYIATAPVDWEGTPVDDAIARFGDSTYGPWIYLSSNRKLKVDSGGAEGTTVLDLATWYRISAYISGDGDVNILLNGVAEASGATGVSGWLGCRVCNGSGVYGDLYFDDVVGTDQAADPGDIRCAVVANPNAVGDITTIFDTVHSDPIHYKNYDDPAGTAQSVMDDDWVQQAASAAVQDIANLKDCTPAVPTGLGLLSTDVIDAVNVMCLMSGDAGGIRVKEGATFYSTAMTITTIAWFSVYYALDPAGVAWTQANFDAFQAGGYTTSHTTDQFLYCVMGFVAYHAGAAAPAFKLKMIPKRPWNRMSRLYKSLSLKGG